jgi:DNA-binding transcriptional ArsR family regulator
LRQLFNPTFNPAIETTNPAFNPTIETTIITDLIMEFIENIEWSSGQAIPEEERNMIIMLIGQGLTTKEISQALNRDKRTLNKWIKRFTETGLMKEKKHIGRPRVTTNEEEFGMKYFIIFCDYIKSNFSIFL